MKPVRPATSAAIAIASAVICLSCLAAFPAGAAGAPKSNAEVVKTTVDTFILPRIEKFASSTARLSSAVSEVCGAGDGAIAEKRAAASEAFTETVRIWASLDFIRFGPVMQKNRLERVFFWPDTRAVAQRQITTLAAARKPELLASGALAGQSVAVQGLTALEVLMFDDKAPLGDSDDEAARYRCALAAAVAASLDTVAREIRDGWTAPDGFRVKILNPGKENALYKDDTESAREVIKALVNGLQICRDRYVLPELTGLSRTPPRRVRLPFERAHIAGTFFETTVSALSDYFDVTDLASHLKPEKAWMTGFIATGWKSLVADSARLEGVRTAQPGSDDHFRALRKLRFDFSSVRSIVIKELAANAGIVMGLNELDGD